MGDVINLSDYRDSAKLEEEYLQFLTHVTKMVKTPMSIPELSKACYLSLRYLEGNINCLNILSMLKSGTSEEAEDLKRMICLYMEELLNDLNKY